MRIILAVFLMTTNSFAISSKNYSYEYEAKIKPYYDSIPLKNFSYHNQSEKKFVYKYIRRHSKKLLVILPGKGEQLARYAEMLFDLKDVKSDILLVQFRGQGLSSRTLSDREKTHVDRFEDVIEDMNSLFKKIDIKKNYVKISLFAHSMGGHHGLRFQARYGLFDEIILNAPLIGMFNSSVTGMIYFLAKSLDFIGLDNFYVPGGGRWKDRVFEVNPLSQSVARYKKIREIEFDSPDHRMGAVTVRWAHEAFKSEKLILSNISRFNVPISLFQAGKESVISNEKQTLFCRKVRSCKLFHLEGAKHNIMQERDKYRTPLINYLKASI